VILTSHCTAHADLIQYKLAVTVHHCLRGVRHQRTSLIIASRGLRRYSAVFWWCHLPPSITDRTTCSSQHVWFSCLRFYRSDSLKFTAWISVWPRIGYDPFLLYPCPHTAMMRVWRLTSVCRVHRA